MHESADVHCVRMCVCGICGKGAGAGVPGSRRWISGHVLHEQEQKLSMV
jgi:hypothetical protein